MFLSNGSRENRTIRHGTQSQKLRFEALEDRRMLFATFGGDAVWPFTELSYSYSNLLDNAILPTNQVITAVEEAMAFWFIVIVIVAVKFVHILAGVSLFEKT